MVLQYFSEADREATESDNYFSLRLTSAVNQRRQSGQDTDLALASILHVERQWIGKLTMEHFLEGSYQPLIEHGQDIHVRYW